MAVFFPRFTAEPRPVAPVLVRLRTALVPRFAPAALRFVAARFRFAGVFFFEAPFFRFDVPFPRFAEAAARFGFGGARMVPRQLGEPQRQG